MNKIHCTIVFPFLGTDEDYDFPLGVDPGDFIDQEREEEDRLLEEYRKNRYPVLSPEGEDYLVKLIRENDPTSMNLYMLTEHYDVNWETFKSRYPSEASIYKAWSNCDMLLI